MTEVGTNVSEIHQSADADPVPQGLSFFEPYLQHSIKEALAIGGEVFVSRASDGTISGIFIYDDFEKTGTVYTRSREIFDYFYDLKPHSFLWSELRTEHESETYDIYSVNLVSLPVVHSFSHQITVANDSDIEGIGRFMAFSHPGINPNWVKVALKNGEKCFLVNFHNEIAGMAWLSVVNNIGRLFSLYVKPQFRRMGVGEDLLFARLLWLKSTRISFAFSEISRNNPASARIAFKGHMNVTAQVYQYYGKEHGHRPAYRDPRNPV